MRNRMMPMLIGLAILVFPAIVWNNGVEEGIDPEIVFNWVREQMQAPSDVPPPQIHFVDRLQLRQLFETRSKQSFQNWQAAYGSGHARQIMKDYLKDVVGIFIPESQTVFVGRFLSPCRQKAILAHELTHYFQHHAQSESDRAMAVFDPEAMNMILEMEAYKIENHYMERFCPEPMAP